MYISITGIKTKGFLWNVKVYEILTIPSLLQQQEKQKVICFVNQKR